MRSLVSRKARKSSWRSILEARTDQPAAFVPHLHRICRMLVWVGTVGCTYLGKLSQAQELSACQCLPPLPCHHHHHLMYCHRLAEPGQQRPQQPQQSFLLREPAHHPSTRPTCSALSNTVHSILYVQWVYHQTPCTAPASLLPLGQRRITIPGLCITLYPRTSCMLSMLRHQLSLNNHSTKAHYRDASSHYL